MNYNELFKKYKHLTDLYNQLLKDYDEEMQKNKKAIEMFESDEHFEDGCYCEEIERLLKR